MHFALELFCSGMMHFNSNLERVPTKMQIGKGRTVYWPCLRRELAGEMHILVALAMPFINIAAEDGTTVIICDFNNLYQYTIHELCVCTL